MKGIYTDTGTGLITDVCYVDGYYIASGYSNTDDGAFVAYAASPSDTWTIMTIVSADTNMGIVYDNGYYLIGGDYDGDNGYISYTTSLTGTWTTTILTSQIVDGLTGGDGYFVRYENIYYISGDQCQIVYATDPETLATL